MRVIIIGAGGFSEVIADILLQSQQAGEKVEPIGYLDDNHALEGKYLCGLPVLGGLEKLPDIAHDSIVIAIGNNATRQRLYQTYHQRGERFATACHPKAVIPPDVAVGPGTMICAGVVVNPGSTVAANVILSVACTISHHNYIGDHAHIAPGVHMGGDVTIGEGTLVGIGAIVMPQRSIGCWSIVSAGALVNKNLPDRVVAAGSPARIIRTLTTES